MWVVAESFCYFADVGPRLGSHATVIGQRLRDEASGDARHFGDVVLCHGTLACGHGHLLYSQTIRKSRRGGNPPGLSRRIQASDTGFPVFADSVAASARRRASIASSMDGVGLVPATTASMNAVSSMR